MARYIVALVLLAVIAGPAFAEEKPDPKDPNPLHVLELQRRKEAAAVEKKYEETLKKSDKTAAPARVDPWQNMRGAEDAKAKR